MTVTTARTDKLDALHRRLSADVLGLISGTDWQDMLTVASRFHRYRTGTRRYSKRPNSGRNW